MEKIEIQRLLGFYENQLYHQILPFWLPRCVDGINGGFLNCFDNKGENLLSHDKYTWSQGRFVWVFSKLASMRSNIFSKAERAYFLSLAQEGTAFLQRHCLMGPDDWRCVFLMDETGAAKQVANYDALDMSIYADCFVISALAKYASVSGDTESYTFAKHLYASCLLRISTGNYNTLPYPLSPAYSAHGVSMIMVNVCCEIYNAAQVLMPNDCLSIKEDMRKFSDEVLYKFADNNFTLREIVYKDGSILPQLLGQHMNPGHTLEDMWFEIECADIIEEPGRLDRIARIASKALENGWDNSYGGILHYCGIEGGEPFAPVNGTEGEPMQRQVIDGWSDKLWWVHSEALYSTLLLHYRTGDPAFLAWHERVFEYVFNTFPNKDPEIREWTQIRRRNGIPEEKVVALPVKDPYHIIRNLSMLIELLEQKLHEKIHT